MQNNVTKMSEAMKEQCVVGVYKSLDAAKLAIHVLERAGFVPQRVSLVTRHIEAGTDVEHELSTGDDSLRDATIGAALGGLVGVLGEATLLAVAGIGAVVVTGPLMIAAGIVVGGLVGAMEGWGIHEAHLRKYENLLREGRCLVVVDGNPREVTDADRMLRETDAQEVHLYAESSDDAPEILDQDKP